MTTSFHDDDRDNEPLRPSGWKAAWEAAQDELAPSQEIKQAAETLVWCESLQQSMGWLLLTIIGLLLGSFGQVMSQGVCLLSWGIFTLEAILKYGRSWAHSHFFRDVPCAYVPIHQEAAHNSLAFFGIFVFCAIVLELALYVPYIYSAVRFYEVHVVCYHNDSSDNCPDGTTRLVEMLIASIIIVCLHWISSLGTVYAFKAAMGMGITALTLRGKRSPRKDLRSRCIKRFSTKRTPSDRLLCLTWWVHMARHRHLSSVVASAQPADCGLPGHWFESVHKLKRIVEECDVGDQVHLDPSGPLYVSQEMALRALISLAKQPGEQGGQICKEILHDNGFLLLVRVVRAGKRETCRGLAAAAIAVLALQSNVLQEENVDLTTAVVPLKRLARSTNIEQIEVAYGALLNASINEKQSSDVIAKLLSDNGIAIGEDEHAHNFVSSIIDHAHRSHTTRCQELAVGLLSCLVGERKGKPVRIALGTESGRKVHGLQLCTALLKHGLTAQIQAGAAGILAELAYWKDGPALGSGPYSEGYIGALVDGLQHELTIAFASTRALCSLAYNQQDNKLKIVNAGAIKPLVDLLRDHSSSSQHSRGSFDRRDSNHVRIQRRTSGISLEALKKIDEVDASSHTGSSHFRRNEKDQLEEKVRSDAARALRFLALNNPHHQDLIVEEGAIPLLINVLSSRNPKVHVQVIPAVSALAWKSRTNQNMIGEYEDGKFFQGLASALAITNDNAEMADKILEKVCHATKILVEGNESNRQSLLRHKIIKQKLEDCIANNSPQDKRNEKAAQNAKKALEVLDDKQS